MNRRNDVIEKEGPFAYAKDGHGEEEMVNSFIYRLNKKKINKFPLGSS